MKQVWYERENTIALREVSVPAVGPRQVRVRIAYAALCATDLHMVTMGILDAKPPMPLGHEAAGIVEEVGKEAALSGIRPGDKVCLFPVTFCGQCPDCKEGKPQYCKNAKPTGAFAEYVVTDISAVFKLPDDADLLRYCLAEPTTCAIRAMDLAAIPQGSRVAISGVGGIGMILLNALLLAGGSRVTAIDVVDRKLELAREMGAQYTLNPQRDDLIAAGAEITGGRGYDFVFEASGSPAAARPALGLVGNCGTCVYFAVYPPAYELPVNLYQLYRKEACIRTVFTHPAIMPRAIDLMPRIDTDRIIGKVLPLSQAEEAFALFHQSIYPKIILDCAK